MPAIKEWRNQFGKSKKDIPSEMYSHGRKWLETCDEISKLGSVSLVLTPQQITLFNNCFSGLLTRCLKANENSMAASLARLAINIIRPISIIAVLRRIELCGVSHPAADISSENKKDGIIPSCEVGITYEDFEACI